MDKIKKFDEELKHTYEDVFLFGKIGAAILCSFGMAFMLIPFDWMEQMIGLTGLGCLLCAGGIIQYMQAYVRVKEDNVMVSIYEKLAFMPVTKKQLKKMRCRYLNHMCIRVGTAAFVIQQLMSLLNHSFGWKSILFAAVWAFGVWLISWMELYVQ